jgi:hypothetical protein
MRENYKEITYKLIGHSFPLLRDKKIIIFVAWLRFYALSVWIPPFLRLMVLSTRTRDLDKPAITGLIAHELCHQERYLKMGVMKYLAFAAKFLISSETRGTEEKATDRLTIEKGYGRELYELSVITHEDRNHEKINRFYLSLDEIKSYSESIGKWREIPN